MSNTGVVIYEYERRQLREFLPQAADMYRDTYDLPDVADRLESISESLEDSMDGHSDTYDYGTDVWDTVATALNEIETNRAAWLRAKIARRAGLSPTQMGFTTRQPVGTMVSR
jgi:hypothetical protein